MNYRYFSQWRREVKLTRNETAFVDAKERKKLSTWTEHINKNASIIKDFFKFFKGILINHSIKIFSCFYFIWWFKSYIICTVRGQWYFPQKYTLTGNRKWCFWMNITAPCLLSSPSYCLWKLCQPMTASFVISHLWEEGYNTSHEMFPFLKPPEPGPHFTNPFVPAKIIFKHRDNWMNRY